MSHYLPDQQEIEYLHTALLEVRKEEADLRAQLAAVQAEALELREALIAMREYYKEHMITGKLHKQVEAALAKKEGER